jgi:hypothetical protein
MTGLPGLNFPAFNAAAARLRALGHEVVNPVEINNEDPEAVADLGPDELEAHWRACMKKDIAAMLTCDGVAMLRGWHNSRGAKIEVYIASHLGMRTDLVDDIGPAKFEEAA